jgi:hypothetical protein
MSDSSSEEDEIEDERSICEVGCGVGVVVVVVDMVVVDGDVTRSSEHEDMLSLEVCWGAGMVVGGSDEFIVLIDLVRLIVVSLT